MDLKTTAPRLRLEPRWKPYWHLVAPGISLGYRRGQSAGSWSVRLANGKRGSTIKRIATADDFARADGKGVMTFTQAQKAALQLGSGETEEAKPTSVVTLGEAIEAYRANLKARQAGVDNVSRLLFNLKPASLKRPIALLSVTDLHRWRDAKAAEMAPASVNRLITIMKAVLNLAATRDERLSTRPWEIGLASLPEATTANNVVLPEATIRRLIHAARGQSPEFGLLVEVLALTGARYSQLARCQVRDLIAGRLMIPSSAKGQNKRQSRGPVPIPQSLADRLAVAAQGRPQSGPLLVRPSGEPWGKSDHARPFRRTIEAIGEDPAVVSSYALRHSHITGQLLAGLPVQLVAKLHDTSASQIEKHYAATIAGFGDELVRAAMIEVDRPAADVVPIRIGLPHTPC